MYFPAIVLWRLCNRYQITLHERSHRTTALVSIDNAGQQYAPVPRITALGFSDGAGLRVKRSHPLNPLKARLYPIAARVCRCAPDRCKSPASPRGRSDRISASTPTATAYLTSAQFSKVPNVDPA
jgi:Fe2+ transport system protein FeoA